MGARHLKARILAASAATVLALASMGGVAAATPGEVDTTFDSDGIRTLDLTNADFGHDVLAQPDGRIVMSGSAGTDSVVARFLTDGAFDTDFNLGYLRWDLGGTGEALARTADGKAITAGTVLNGGAYDIAVMRLLADGTPDPAFDQDGFKTIDFGGSESAHGVAVQPDGKIVVAGSADSNELVVRLNADGSPDTQFDGDGKVVLDFGATAEARAVALAPSGKIVVGGLLLNGDDRDMTASRVLADGTPDPSFDDDGLRRIDAGGADYGWDVLVEPDGKVLVVGGSDDQFAAVRLTTSGAPDQTFDGDGVAKADPGGSGPAFEAALQANGKIVLAGQAANAAGRQPVIIRLQPGGARDTTFSADGAQRLTLANSGAESVALQPNGRIVLAGTTVSSNVDAWVARLEGDLPAVGGGPAPGQTSSPGGKPGGEGPGGSTITRVPRCAGKRATIVGTGKANRLKGTRRADVIVGLGGNDTIDGGGGNDLVCAGDGNDTVRGSIGDDRLYGQNGKDRLDGGKGNDRLAGDAGKDSLAGGSGKDRLAGGSGRDSCNGGAGKDRTACERRRGI